MNDHSPHSPSDTVSLWWRLNWSSSHVHQDEHVVTFSLFCISQSSDQPLRYWFSSDYNFRITVARDFWAVCRNAVFSGPTFSPRRKSLKLFFVDQPVPTQTHAICPCLCICSFSSAMRAPLPQQNRLQPANLSLAREQSVRILIYWLSGWWTPIAFTVEIKPHLIWKTQSHVWSTHGTGISATRSGCCKMICLSHQILHKKRSSGWIVGWKSGH